MIVSPGNAFSWPKTSLEPLSEGGCKDDAFEGMTRRVELERPESAVVWRCGEMCRVRSEEMSVVRALARF